MRLAVNWSPQAERLLLDGKIDIDLWKCSDWPELVEPALKTKPAYVHFPLRAGDGSVPDWESVRRWMERTGTKNVNMHLGVTVKDVPDIPFASRDPLHRGKVIDAMVRDVLAAGNAIGMEKIIVENLPTHPHDEVESKPLHCCIEPETVRTVIERTGCRLLLDIDHARIAADVLGMDARSYIESLPIDRIGELHMSGVRRINGLLEDHMGMSDACWEYVDWAIDRMRDAHWNTPDICAFEYGGIGPIFKDRSEATVLAAQVPVLLQKIRSLNT